MWILTREENDYNQHGEYFEAVFKEKPTRQQLLDNGISEFVDNSKGKTVDNIEHLLNKGGGRVHYEETWYNLNEHEGE